MLLFLFTFVFLFAVVFAAFFVELNFDDAHSTKKSNWFLRSENSEKLLMCKKSRKLRIPIKTTLIVYKCMYILYVLKTKKNSCSDYKVP